MVHHPARFPGHRHDTVITFPTSSGGDQRKAVLPTPIPAKIPHQRLTDAKRYQHNHSGFHARDIHGLCLSAACLAKSKGQEHSGAGVRRFVIRSSDHQHSQGKPLHGPAFPSAFETASLWREAREPKWRSCTEKYRHRRCRQRTNSSSPRGIRNFPYAVAP